MYLGIDYGVEKSYEALNDRLRSSEIRENTV